MDYTLDLTKPQTMDFLYGYSFTGFLTVQQMVDRFILEQEIGTNVTFEASVSLMATAKYETDNFWQIVAQVVGKCTSRTKS